MEFRSQSFWGQEQFFDIFLYTANNDTKASKCHYKTHSKLVLLLGTGDRLHLDSTSLLSNDKRKKESKQFFCFRNLRPSAAEELQNCTVFTTIFYPSYSSLLIIYVPRVMLELRVKVRPCRVSKISKSGAAGTLALRTCDSHHAQLIALSFQGTSAAYRAI